MCARAKFPSSPASAAGRAGVPGYSVYTRVEPLYVLQTPKEVTLIIELDQQTRHIYMNVPHSKNPKPSWYGESVGHYEATSWWSTRSG